MRYGQIYGPQYGRSFLGLLLHKTSLYYHFHLTSAFGQRDQHNCTVQSIKRKCLSQRLLRCLLFSIKQVCHLLRLSCLLQFQFYNQDQYIKMKEEYQAMGIIPEESAVDPELKFADIERIILECTQVIYQHSHNSEKT
ncbi:hypothetical protein FGO68_gene10723 [Halteria grandinella]|uniref:Uncharacterized protein n=1 Tax=Halteria grandinella TaxID=5974 RepID=A0A8J8SW30_HALGN|nr:hypothetical protein FGO68_gene10723 [Halteria grandinella]